MSEKFFVTFFFGSCANHIFHMIFLKFISGQPTTWTYSLCNWFCIWGAGSHIRNFFQSFSVICISSWMHIKFVFMLANSMGWIPFKQFCKISHFRRGGVKSPKYFSSFFWMFFCEAVQTTSLIWFPWNLVSRQPTTGTNSLFNGFCKFHMGGGRVSKSKICSVIFGHVYFLLNAY